uniref:Conserved membrane protein n=1 Tax=Haemonchus contortus TaxID=6289 RepID=A0A7I4Z4F6_HAECO
MPSLVISTVLVITITVVHLLTSSQKAADPSRQEETCPILEPGDL